MEASVRRLVVVCSLRQEWCGDRVVTARNSGFRQLELAACRASGYLLSRTKLSVAVKLLWRRCAHRLFALLDKSTDFPLISGIQKSEEVVWYTFSFTVRDFVRDNWQAFVKLHRVGVDHFSIKFEGELHC